MMNDEKPKKKSGKKTAAPRYTARMILEAVVIDWQYRDADYTWALFLSFYSAVDRMEGASAGDLASLRVRELQTKKSTKAYAGHHSLTVTRS